jgi:sugar/nucleoside kinase (ribokinase family)
MYDITFLGHMCFDEITPYKGETHVAPGSAVLCGAMVAARIGKKVSAVVKMAEKDKIILDKMKEENIDVFLIPAPETTYSRVIHDTPNPDERRLVLEKSAGLIKIEEVPVLQTKSLHLAGISDTEFDMALIRSLNKMGYNLSIDMQGFVRHVDPLTREISFDDVESKKEISSLIKRIKMDIVEARVLTGLSDIEDAALKFESWGCPEIVITQSNGVLARVRGKTYYEKFSNSSTIGRTGRGDTTFSAYICRREDHDPAESLKFAAALVSIKMESPGPFHGTLEDVFERMRS